MVRRQGRRPRRQRSIRQVRRRRRSTRQSSRPASSSKSTLGHMIATGVKNVVSLLPGASVLSPLADFVFKAMGISSALQNKVVSTEASIYADLGMFTLSPRNFLATAHNTVSCYQGVEKTFLSPYETARLMNFTITVKPSGVVSNRSGQFLVGVQPLMSDSDVTRWTTSGFAGQGWPTERGIKQMYMSSVFPASEGCTLRFVPRPQHGRAFLPLGINDQFAAVVVRYENYSRNGYVDFNPSDFEANIVCKARFEYMSSYPGVTGPSSMTAIPYVDSVVDLLSSTGMHLSDGKGKSVVLSSKGFKCVAKEDGSCCLVTGEAFKLSEAVPNLDDMVLE